MEGVFGIFMTNTCRKGDVVVITSNKQVCDILRKYEVSKGQQAHETTAHKSNTAIESRLRWKLSRMID